jgi:hypothetical protein
LKCNKSREKRKKNNKLKNFRQEEEEKKNPFYLNGRETNTSAGWRSCVGRSSSLGGKPFVRRTPHEVWSWDGIG